MHRRLRARCGTEHRQGTPRPYRGVARGRILKRRDRGVFGRRDGGSASPEREGGGRLTDVFASAPVLRLPEGVASAPPVPWAEPQNIGEPSPRGGEFSPRLEGGIVVPGMPQKFRSFLRRPRERGVGGMIESYSELIRRRLEDRSANIMANLEKLGEGHLRFPMRIFGDCLD